MKNDAIASATLGSFSPRPETAKNWNIAPYRLMFTTLRELDEYFAAQGYEPDCWPRSLCTKAIDEAR